VEELAAPSPAETIGAAYALKQMVLDSPNPQNEAQRVVSVLAGYIKSKRPVAAEKGNRLTPMYEMSADVQAVLTILGSCEFRDLSNPKASLCHTSLQGADLRLVDLRGIDLSDTDLRNVDLLYATLDRIDLSDANLSKARLKGARLTGARLTGANLTGADLTDAVLADTNFQEATGITREQLGGACGDQRTKLPAGITAPEQWSSKTCLDRVASSQLVNHQYACKTDDATFGDRAIRER
jgi:hypothetical protein